MSHSVEEHMAKAEDALLRAEKAASSGVPVAASWAAIAQAHLMAANVKDLLGLSRMQDDDFSDRPDGLR